MPSRRKLVAGGLCALGVGATITTCGVAALLEPDVHALSLTGLGIEAGLALIALAGVLVSSRTVNDGLGLVRSRLSLSKLLVVVVGTLALSHALDSLLSLSGLREHSALARFDALLAGVRGGDLALALLALVVAPAFGEELLCRGWIQRGLQPRLGAGRAVAVAALIFGLLHLDPIHALFAIFLGLYLGTIACWAGSTWPGIVCHGVNNAVAVLVGVGLLPTLPLDLPGVVLGMGLAGAALWAARPSGATAESAAPGPSSLQEQPRSDDS